MRHKYVGPVGMCGQHATQVHGAGADVWAACHATQVRGAGVDVWATCGTSTLPYPSIGNLHELVFAKRSTHDLHGGQQRESTSCVPDVFAVQLVPDALLLWGVLQEVVRPRRPSCLNLLGTSSDLLLLHFLQ